MSTEPNVVEAHIIRVIEFEGNVKPVPLAGRPNLTIAKRRGRVILTKVFAEGILTQAASRGTDSQAELPM